MRYYSVKRIFFISITFFLLSSFLGYFLPLNEAPKQVDSIIVLSGGSARVEKAAALYKEGYATYVILSNSKEIASSHGDMLQTAMVFGIPSDVILSEEKAQSTYQNAELTLLLMKKHGFNSAIVVSSDFHMRRVKFNFDQVYKKSGIELTYIGAASGYNAKRWWSDSYSRESTFNEYVKMIGNVFGYNGSEAKSILEKFKGWFR